TTLKKINMMGGAIMRRISLLMLAIFCGLFILSSCSTKTAITKATVTDYTDGGAQLTIYYRFSNLGSASLSSYWIRFEIKASNNSTSYYTHEKTKMVNSGSIFTDSLTISNPYPGNISSVTVV